MNRRTELKVISACFILMILAFLVLVATPAEKQDKPSGPFRSLQFIYVGGDGIDFGLTYAALSTGKYKELNPAASWYVDKPILGLAVHAAIDIGVVTLTSKLYKSNRTLAWIFLGAATVVKGYILFRNFRTLEGK
jgi:hypothetical protein